MFTGIVQNLGMVKKVQKRGGQVCFVFEFTNVGARSSRPNVRGRKLDGVTPPLQIKVGASIAVNGVCLTATKVTSKSFQADVIKQTLEATNLGALKVGSCVNLERSLRYGDELGGHFVTGHIDAQGKVLGIIKSKNNTTFKISFPKEIIQFIAKKGSVTVDGISLTIQKVTKTNFEVGIIPHTLKVTNLKQKRVGDCVNLEVDLVARYIHRLDEVFPKTSIKPSSKKTIKKLKSQGF